MSDKNTLQPGTSIKAIVDSDQVKKLVFELYGFKVINIVELNSYDDKTYHINVERVQKDESGSVCSSGYVFKVINSLDSKKPEVFDAQNLILEHLSKLKT